MGNVYLIGFMGAGKSTIGFELSRLLDCALVDLDDMIEQEEGMSISSIFSEKGEGYFRERESSCLVRVSGLPDKVVATGGGVVERPENLEIMEKTGVTVYLQADIDTVLRRLELSGDRPLADQGNNWKRTRELFQKRLPLYETGMIRIDASKGRPRDIAKTVLDQLNRR